MKRNTTNVTIILTVLFVITLITVARIMAPPTQPTDPAMSVAIAPDTPSSPAALATPQSPDAISPSKSAVATASLPAPNGVVTAPAVPVDAVPAEIASESAMEEARELPMITPGAALDVVSLMAGRIQILDDKNQILAEVTGQTPRIRCHADVSQTLYKVRFQPDDGCFGIQRVFPLALGQANAYVRIVANPQSPAKILLTQQTWPFDS